MKPKIFKGAPDTMSAGKFRYKLSCLGLTQQALAQLTSVHPNTLSRYATGKIPVPMLMAAYLQLLNVNQQMRRQIDGYIEERI